MFKADKGLSVSEVTGVRDLVKRQELAAAMRRGCEILPRQHHGWLWAHRIHKLKAGVHKIKVASCALGAAFDGGWRNRDFLQDTHAFCPVPACPLTGNPHSVLRGTIVHLNEHHEWTRERIADWLETGR